MVCISRHHITGELLNTRDYGFTTRAYETMTPEQIKMSEERMFKMRKESIEKQIEYVQNAEETSRETIKDDKTSYRSQAA